MLPFDRFAGADALLGPEMRSTGEVMGIAADFPTAFAKAQAAAGAELPDAGDAVFITVTDRDKPAAGAVAILLDGLGFRIVATGGTARVDRAHGHPRRAAQQDRRGLAARRRLRSSSGDVDLVINTPDRHGRALGRLGDPRRRRGPRDPVHHDDGRRARRRAGDLGGAQVARRRCISLQELHGATDRRGLAGAVSAERRTLAPFGRRRLTIADRCDYGAYVVLHADRPGRARRRGPGQFYMLAAAERWGEAPTSGPSCPRAFSVPALDARGRAATSSSRTSARARTGSASSRPGDELWVTGPFGIGFARARGRPAAAARRRRRGDRAAGRLAGRARARRAGAARLPRRRPRRRAPPCSARPSWPPTTARSATTASSPSCSPASSTRTPHATVYACGPPPMLEAVRALCAGARRAGPARARVGHGLRLRRLLRLRRARRAAGYVRLCVDGPGARRRRARGRCDDRRSAASSSRHPVLNASGTFDAIAARRAFGRGPARRLPLRRLRLQDGHARAARGQPAAPAVGARLPG